MSDNNDNITVYQNKKAKAEDYKSSSYTLILMGVIGIVALILMIAGVLPFQFAGSGKYITYGVMGILFAGFIVTGVSSFKSAKRYTREAADEEDLTAKIKIWAKEHITADTIKQHVWFEDGTPEEMKYFQYFEAIKAAVEREFGSLDVSYLEALCEELYAEIFEE
ncbi:MAG: O-antigen ligase family protein [Lachnospiraceae bacterium]|nr:O-antigen ligase family protein [Lachnospiraceae bacterium]